MVDISKIWQHSIDIHIFLDAHVEGLDKLPVFKRGDSIFVNFRQIILKAMLDIFKEIKGTSSTCVSQRKDIDFS